MQLRSQVPRPPRARYWTEIIPYGAAQNVPAVLTTLLAFTDYGTDFEQLAVFLSNEDATHTADLIVDVSHGGTKKIGELTQTKTVNAGEEGYVLLGPSNPYTYLRVAAQSGFSVQVKWALLGVPR